MTFGRNRKPRTAKVVAALMLEARLRAAAGLNPGEGWPPLDNLAPVEHWIERGADLDLDILPAVRERSMTVVTRTILTWRFYENDVIRRAVARRGAGAMRPLRRPAVGRRAVQQGRGER